MKMGDGKYWQELISYLQEEFSEYESLSTPEDIIDTIRNLKADKQVIEDVEKHYKRKLKHKEEKINMLKSNMAIAERKESDIKISSMSSSSAGDIGNLMKTIQLKKQEIVKLTQENEMLKNRLEESDNKEYFDHFQKRFNDVAQQRDDAINQGAAKDDRIRHLDEVVNELRQKIGLEDQLSNNKEQSGTDYNSGLAKALHGTFQVLLKREEVNGKFGVSFGIKNGVIPRITESRVVVCKVDYSIHQAKKVREGDFVMEINGCNTQLASMDDVRFRCGNTNLKLLMTLRRPIDPRQYDITGNKKNSADHKLEVGLYFKNVNPECYGHLIGIREQDEIIKINGKDPGDITINKVIRKLSRQFNLKVHRKYVDDVLESLFPVDEDQLTTTSSGYGSASHSNSIASQSLSSLSTSIVRAQRILDTADLFSIEEELLGEDFSTPSGPIKQVTIYKKRHESFGFNLIGGNNIGVFVEDVRIWTPAYTAKIGEKWKIIKINGYSVIGVAHYYVKELINHFKGEESLTITFECTSPDEYENAIRQTQYDYFHVEAMDSYTDENKKQIFSTGDILRVEDTSAEKWVAVNQTDGVTVYIPPLPSKFHGQKEHEYEEFSPTQEEKSKMKLKQNSEVDRLYKFLDDVEIKIYS